MPLTQFMLVSFCQARTMAVCPCLVCAQLAGKDATYAVEDTGKDTKHGIFVSTHTSHGAHAAASCYNTGTHVSACCSIPV